MNDRHIEPGPLGPLGQAAQRLLECLAAAGVTARLGGSEGEGVSVHPIAIVPETLPGKGDQPLRMRLRCLVHAGGPASAALEALDRILQIQQPYLVPEEPPTTIWTDLGLKPQPGLLFDVPVQFARVETLAPRVTGMPQWETVSLGTVAGRVVASGGTPLAGMRVSTVDGLVTTHTDPRGNFTLRGVPVPLSTGDPIRLVVAGHGLRFTASVTDVLEPVVINCEIQEN
ncbi:MAG TPA: carboxypeptidase-like regulatory domain-containing protein [Candidatus Limnocylindrales bacterium]|nr:carboxypeptidase-like regulatory domain-containing protein [Candidatus Limnocylindrales bacterium]